MPRAIADFAHKKKEEVTKKANSVSWLFSIQIGPSDPLTQTEDEFVFVSLSLRNV